MHKTQKDRDHKDVRSGARDEDFRMTLLFSPKNSRVGPLSSERCNALLLLDPRREGTSGEAARKSVFSCVAAQGRQTNAAVRTSKHLSVSCFKAPTADTPGVFCRCDCACFALSVSERVFVRNASVSSIFISQAESVLFYQPQ